MDFLRELGVIDVASVALLAVFLVRGLMQGFVWQAITLVGVIAGLLVSRSLAPVVAPAVRKVVPSLDEQSGLDMMAAYFVVFLGVLVAAALLAKLARKLTSSLSLGSHDRLLGGLFGVVKAGAIIVIAVTFLSMFDPAKQAIASSRTGPLANEAVKRAGPLFPEEVKEHVRETVERLEEHLRPDDDEGDDTSGN